MKACVLHGIGDLRYEEVADPVAQPDEVLLRIRASGICGSDIARVFEKGTYHFPTIPGHEFTGEIVAAGDASQQHLVGKRTAVFPMLPCFTCAACELGEYAQCGNYDYYGSRRDGGFAEYLAVKTWNLVPIPDDVSYEEAALCEPAAVAIHALSQAGVNPGETVAVFGAGPIGLMLGKLALAMGAGTVILTDIDERKLAFAQNIGFTHCINVGKTDAPAEIRALTGGTGAQVVVEGTGAAQALRGCVNSAADFGRVVLMGNPAGDMGLSQKDYWTVLRKQLTLKGTWNSSYTRTRNDWKTALALMPRLDVSALVTHRFPLRDCEEAFALIRDRKEPAVKILFTNP